MRKRGRFEGLVWSGLLDFFGAVGGDLVEQFDPGEWWDVVGGLESVGGSDFDPSGVVGSDGEFVGLERGEWVGAEIVEDCGFDLVWDVVECSGCVPVWDGVVVGGVDDGVWAGFHAWDFLVGVVG